MGRRGSTCGTVGLSHTRKRNKTVCGPEVSGRQGGWFRRNEKRAGGSPSLGLKCWHLWF